MKPPSQQSLNQQKKKLYFNYVDQENDSDESQKENKKVSNDDEK